MTDAELAALARAATTVPPTVTTYPDWMLPLGKHMRAWTPARALAALAVIAAAEKIVAGDPKNVRGLLHGAGIVEGWRHDCAVLQPALDAWRALP